MNRKICIQNIEKIKGRSASFGVTVESKSINSEYNNLYSFIDYLRDFDEEKKPKTLRLNQLTLGTAQTKTISLRIAFNIIEKKKGQFIDFLKKRIS